MSADIEILPAEQIDKQKWDECIRLPENGLIYSSYDYLDAICDNWHGLIVNDYRSVMALPWRKRFGIRYFYEPAFTQQLGFIGNTDTGNIMQTCFEFARYGDLLFNFNNSALAAGLKGTTRTNLILDLSPGYDTILSGYKKDLQQNLKKSEREDLSYLQCDHTTAITLYRSSYHDRFQHISKNEYARFEKLCDTLSKNAMCFSRKVVDATGDILSTGLFLKDEKRIYNIMNTTTGAGRDAEANHFLLHNVITEFAGKKLLFDFEGSDIPGVKKFYEKFGATDQPYYHYHFNRLPFPLKLLRR